MFWLCLYVRPLKIKSYSSSTTFSTEFLERKINTVFYSSKNEAMILYVFYFCSLIFLSFKIIELLKNLWKNISILFAFWRLTLEFIFQYHFHLASSFKLWIFYFWIMPSYLWFMDWRQCQSSEKHFGAFLFLRLFCFPLLPVTKIRQLSQWELHWGWPWTFNCILGTFCHKFKLSVLLKIAFYCHPFLFG